MSKITKTVGLPRPLLLAIAVALVAPAAHAANFIYEGHLDDVGQPANGRYDLQLSAYGAAAQGAMLAAPVTFHGVEVREGRFRLDVELPLVKADQVWLEVAVRSSGEPSFSAIPGRAKAIAAPLIGACWSTIGDSGVNPTTNFIGTTDAQPFVIRTGNVPSLRIEPSAELFGGFPPRPITTNTISGSRSNFVTTGVRGATIAGGGVPTGLSDPDFVNENPNRVTDHYGSVGGGYANRAGDNAGTTADNAFATVGGGFVNTASGSWSSVGGGYLNVASDSWTTVGGGDSNTASRQSSTVGGGSTNTASALFSTVGGGIENTASGQRSSVGGGSINTASGFSSTVGGGSANCAGGDYSWAGGLKAKVRPGSNPGGIGACSGLTYPGGTGDQGTFVWADSQFADFVSTGDDQFLVRAQGGFGFNTNSPVTDFDVVGNRGAHAMLVRNESATSADGIAIQLNEATPTTANNFLTFQRAGGTSVGSVEGNGGGGVVFNTSGGDYAEYLPLAAGLAKAMLRPGLVVAVRGGVVSLDTTSAQQLGVISTNPAVSGNDPGEAKRDAHALIAFLGQVDVAVVGPVAAGDFLVASGRHDGSAIGIAPAVMTADRLGAVVGRAWTASTGFEGTVRALVGLNPADAAQSAALAKLAAELAELRALVRSNKMER